MARFTSVITEIFHPVRHILCMNFACAVTCKSFEKQWPTHANVSAVIPGFSMQQDMVASKKKFLSFLAHVYVSQHWVKCNSHINDGGNYTDTLWLEKRTGNSSNQKILHKFKRMQNFLDGEREYFTSNEKTNQLSNCICKKIIISHWHLQWLNLHM